jgi:hypothetical protein
MRHSILNDNEGRLAQTGVFAWIAQVDTEVDPYQWGRGCVAKRAAAMVRGLGRDKLGSPTNG